MQQPLGLYQYHLGNITFDNPGLAPIARYLAGLTPYSAIQSPTPAYRYFNPVAAAAGAAPRAAAANPAARAHLLSIILGG